MDETRFSHMSQRLLNQLLDQLEDALGDIADVDLQQSILTVELDAGGQYVINGHNVAFEMWVSSPVSGAHHFRYDEGQQAWRTDHHEFATLLQQDLQRSTGRIIALNLQA